MATTAAQTSSAPRVDTHLGKFSQASVVILTALAFLLNRRFVEKQRQQALAALPSTASFSNHAAEADSLSSVRILAFSSADCHQCHTLQTPALRQVQEVYGDSVTIVDVDAPNEPELTRRYHVLTVPTTVVLDAAGRPHAVNYGFAPAPKLIAASARDSGGQGDGKHRPGLHCLFSTSITPAPRAPALRRRWATHPRQH